MVLKKQMELFDTDKKSVRVQATDNLAEKKRLAQALLNNIEEKLGVAVKLLERQYVSKK